MSREIEEAMRAVMPNGPGYEEVIYYGDDARRRLTASAIKVSEAVLRTLGPAGHNVVLDRIGMAPTVTKDGITVLYDIDDWIGRLDTITYELLRETGETVNRQVGDGTTSVIFLTVHLMKELNRLMTAGLDERKIREGVQKAVQFVTEGLAEMAVEARDERALTAALYTAANAEQEIIDTLVDVFLEVGDEGMIFIRDSKSVDTQVFYEEGFVLPCKPDTKELLSSQTADVNWENPYILVTKDPIRSYRDVLHVMELIAERGETKNLIIAYSETADDALDIIHRNNRAEDSPIKVTTFRMPLYQERQQAYLEDFAAFADATIIDGQMTEWNLQNIGLEQLGRADEVRIGHGMIRGVGGRGGKVEWEPGITRLQHRLNQVKEDRDLFTGNFEERTRHNERVAKLLGAVVSICPGAHSEAEAKRKRGVYEDAVLAGQSALKSGLIPGGGWALYKLAERIDYASEPNHEVRAGMGAAAKAFQAMFQKFCKDYGRAPQLVARDINAKAEDIYTCINFRTNEIGHMLDIKVVDSEMGLQVVIDQAVSVALTLMNIGCIITREPTAEWRAFKENQRLEHLKM